MQPGERTKKALGIRVAAIRQDRGLSAKGLARALEVHSNTIYQLERGEQWISAELLEKLTSILKVDMAAFFTPARPRIEPRDHDLRECQRRVNAAVERALQADAEKRAKSDTGHAPEDGDGDAPEDGK